MKTKLKKANITKIYEVEGKSFNDLKLAKEYAKSLEVVSKLDEAKSALTEVVPSEVANLIFKLGFVDVLSALKTYEKALNKYGAKTSGLQKSNSAI